MTEPELRALAARDATLSAEEEAIVRRDGRLEDSTFCIRTYDISFQCDLDDIWATLDAEREKVRVLREALNDLLVLAHHVGLERDAIDEIDNGEAALATTEPKP